MGLMVSIEIESLDNKKYSHVYVDDVQMISFDLLRVDLIGYIEVESLNIKKFLYIYVQMIF